MLKLISKYFRDKFINKINKDPKEETIKIGKLKMASANLPGYVSPNYLPPLTAVQAAAQSSQYVISNSGVGAIGAIAQNTNTYLTGAIPGSYYNITSMPNAGVISFHGINNQEIVRLNKDGSVTWANGIDEDEAAKAFSRSMSQGAELSAGITYAVKQRMRDAMFEEMIEMANTKGSLTAEDLTYLHQAAKIMDKLQGIK